MGQYSISGIREDGKGDDLLLGCVRYGLLLLSVG